MSSNILKRYIWLINLISSRGPITKEDIDFAWAESEFCKGTHEVLPRESFNRYRRDIEQLFDIHIVCDRSKRTYSIDSKQPTSPDIQWFTSSFSLSDSVRQSEQLASRIEFEPIPKGLKYLPIIVDAMSHQVEIRIVHQSFHRTDPHAFNLQPYGLKLYHQRWYIVGYSDEYQEVRTFALDRIHKIILTDISWILPTDFNLHNYYRPYVGVLRDKQPEIIRIRVTGSSLPYLRTLPIHYSQQEIERTDEYSIFQYNVAPTFEFIQELRARAYDIKVLAPRSLAELMRSDLQRTLALYKD
ncbi:MAG: helix-turn-helix transcriptional regulator [Paludibacteraceae bacterium]